MNVGEIDYEAVISAKLYQSTYRLFFTSINSTTLISLKSKNPLSKRMSCLSLDYFCPLVSVYDILVSE